MRIKSYRLADKKIKNNMNTKKYISLIVGLVTIGSLALTATAFAQTAQPGAQNGGRFGKGMMGCGRPAVAGTVLTNDGSTLTVSGKQGFNSTTSTTFTVDTTSATKVTKSNAASTVSALQWATQ